jgi:hypothetical protein
MLPMVVVVLAYQVGAHAVDFYGVPQSDFPKYKGTMKYSSEPVYEFVRSITKERNDLLVTNYGALIYLKADRLPASGNLFYLPWQAEYDRSPIDGYRIDICGDIERHRPAVIWLLNRRIFASSPGSGRSIDEYEPCVLALIVGGYTPLSFGSPWHIRNDVLELAKSDVPQGTVPELNLEPNSSKILYTSKRLSPVASIPLLADQNNIGRRLPLRRIGILFTTYGRRNTGAAELHLEGVGASLISVRFELEGVMDNKYKYFDLDLKKYIKGEVRSLGGGGISTWESHFVQGAEGDATKPSTCIIYEYGDGSRRYTPTCPIM